MKKGSFGRGLAAGMAAGLLLAGFAVAQEPESAARPTVTIKELMEKTITPATNTLWNAFEPPSDEQWTALEEAAVTLLVAANVTAIGGTGPSDNDWAKDPRWQAFDRVLIDAGRQALAAIRARDLTALQAAGDAIYTPCEGCHALFNPGVVNAAQ
jgi:hypothetical protein